MADRTWSSIGAVNDNWSTPGNWDGGLTVPSAGDNIIFDGAISNRACNIDVVVGTYGAVTFANAYTGTITLQVNTNFGAVAQSTACTIAIVTYTLGATTYQCSAGVITATTGTYSFSSNLVIDGGTFGSNTAHTLTVGGNYTRSSGTHNAPTGNFNMNGSTYTPSGGTFNNDSGTVVFGIAGTCTLGAAATSMYNVTINAGATLNTSAASSFAFTASNVVSLTGVLACNASTISIATGVTTAYGLTINAGGVFTGGSGTHTIGSVSSNTATSNTTMTSGTCHIDGISNGTLTDCFTVAAASTFAHSNGTINFTGSLGSTGRNINVNGKSFYTVTATMDSNQGGNGTRTSSALTIADTLTINGGAASNAVFQSGLSGSVTVTGLTTVTKGSLVVNNSTCTLNGGVTINGASAAAAVMTTLNAGLYDCNGAFALTQGTYSHTIATTSTFSGATFTVSGGTFTCTNGTTMFDGGGAITVSVSGSTGTAFFNVATATASTAVTQGSAITAAGTTGMVTAASTSWNTSAASSYALTVTYQFNLATGSTLSTNNSTFLVSSGLTGISTYEFTVGGTFNAGTGAHTFGCLTMYVDVTLTSGITTINGTRNASLSLYRVNGTLSHNNGTVIFAGATTQKIYTVGSSPISLYDVQINNASCILRPYGVAFPLTVVNTFNIILGTLNTLESGSVLITLIISGTSSITGTLTTNTSTITTTGLVTVNAGGTFGGATAYTWAINGGVTNSGGTINCGTGTDTLAASKTFANTTGTVNINGGNFWGASSTTSVVTGGGTWNWASVNTKLLDYQFAIVTGGAAITITMSGNIQTDAVTVTANDMIAVVSYTITVDGAFSNSGATTFTTGTAVLNSTLAIPAGTFGSATAYTLDLNGSLLASAGTMIAPTTATFTFSGATWNTPTIFTHSSSTVIFDLSGTSTLGNNSNGFFDLTVNDGTTFITSTFDITVADILSIGLGGAGATLTSTSGTKTATFFYVDVNSVCTCNASTFISTNLTWIGGTLNRGTTSLSFGAAYSLHWALEVDGTITSGGSGSCTFGSILANATANITLSTGNTTISSRNNAASSSMYLTTGMTWAANSGTITVTQAVTGTSIYTGNTGQYHLFNLIQNTVDSTTLVTPLIIDNTLTITLGQLHTGALNNALTVSGTTSVTGTLTCNSSIITFTGGCVLTGTITAMTSTIRLAGSFNISAGTFTCGTSLIQFTSGITNFLIPASQTIYDLRVDLGANVTCNALLTLTGTIVGSVTNDQLGTNALTIHDLTIVGTLHALYGWSHTINGVSIPGKVNGVPGPKIYKINGVIR